MEITGDPVRLHLTPESTIGELLTNPVTRRFLEPMTAAGRRDDTAGEALGMDTRSSMAWTPFGRIRSLGGGRGRSREQLEELLAKANAEAP